MVKNLKSLHQSVDTNKKWSIPTSIWNKSSKKCKKRLLLYIVSCVQVASKMCSHYKVSLLKKKLRPFVLDLQFLSPSSPTRTSFFGKSEESFSWAYKLLLQLCTFFCYQNLIVSGGKVGVMLSIWSHIFKGMVILSQTYFFQQLPSQDTLRQL